MSNIIKTGITKLAKHYNTTPKRLIIFIVLVDIIIGIMIKHNFFELLLGLVILSALLLIISVIGGLFIKLNKRKYHD